MRMSVDILDRVYDAYTGEMGQHFMRETQRRVHWMCSAAMGGSVLDIGCSQGLVPILLGREGKQVIGIDNSAEAIRKAESHLLTEPVDVRKRVTFVTADVVTHAFGAQRFDCVLMGEVLEHLLQPERLVQVAAQLLETGSRLVVTVPFGINDHFDHKHTFYLSEPLRLLSEHFDIVEVALLGKWLGLVGTKRAPDASRPTSSWSNERVQQLEGAFHVIERALVDDVASLRSKLDDANTKYRSSSEDAARLKRESAHHEGERKTAERACADLQKRLSDATERNASAPVDRSEELASLQTELRIQRETLHAREVFVARLEERVTHVGQLRELELAVRDSEISRLQRERAELELQLRNVEEQAVRRDELAKHEATQRAEERRIAQTALAAQELLTQNERARADAEGARARELDARTSELLTLQAQQQLDWQHTLAEKETELARSDEARRSLEQTLVDGRQQASHLAGALAAAEQELARERQQALLLQDELTNARAMLIETQATLLDVQQRFEAREADFKGQSETRHDPASADLQQALDSAFMQRQALERSLESQRNGFRDLERRAEQWRQQLLAATQAERRATQRLEQERRGKLDAERKAIQTRNTLSFQLGYELIHGFKSRARLRALPRSLWALKKEAERRREARGQSAAADAASARTTSSPRVTNATQAPPPSRAEARSMPAGSAQSPASVEHKRSRPSESLPATSAAPSTPKQATPRRTPAMDTGLSQLRVACIHDEFTFSSYAPECKLLQLTPERFRKELEGFDPELLFVESAWRGKDELWGKKISHRGRELVEAVEWCRARGVPTVFWNKEDPVHFTTFLNTAKLFDFVFTTDVDCIPRYRQALGHDRVFLLPFACQPKLQNPIEKYERKDALAFAGAYYARYPERQQDLASFAHSFTEAPRLEIFDRNHGKDDPNYAFPEEYRQFIVGTLPFDGIDRAYKGYRYALNLNSIKESQTMFARRVFELLASNTTTISNFSRGVRLLFGDLVITTDSGPRALESLRQLAIDDGRARRLRLAALRKVLCEHTYGQRLRFVASRVWSTQPKGVLPRVTVLAFAGSSAAIARVVESFNRQSHADKHLVLVTPSHVEFDSAKIPRSVRRLTAEMVRGLRIADVAPETDFVASLCERDYYGENYLLDLVLATTYSRAQAIGKVARYASDGTTLGSLHDDGAQYRPTPRLASRAALINKKLIATESLGEWLDDLATRRVASPDCLAIDEFNYCENGAELAPRLLEQVRDLTDVDRGLTLDELTRQAIQRDSVTHPQPKQRQISAERLAAVLKAPGSKAFSLTFENGVLAVKSALADETHEYLYANQVWKPEELGFPLSNKLRLEASPGLNLQAALLFLDEKKQRVGHRVFPAARNESVNLPAETAFVQLGLRIYGSGSANISGLLLDHAVEVPERILGRSDYLLVTNHYPSESDLYRNAFVHRRVADYRRQGTRVDVFRHRASEKLGYREFDGVDVISGGNDALAALLRSHPYKAVLVHFLDPNMWQVLREHAGSARQLIWLHGAEVQAWHRRLFNYATEAERETAKVKSAQRDAFWREVLQHLPETGKLIFVSRHFLDQTLGDLALGTEHPKCTVIHNLIDGELFRYHQKSEEQRKRVLSIRPYVSRKYANDLTVGAILELTKKPYFDQLFFHLIGDGPLFDETVAPLRGLANVELEKGFLTQQQIANLHRDYGVFLCPTRDDTQGVSRDEAMASGLVPVTNRVSAIPEFVDEDCAMLAAADSCHELADGIARLFEAPSLFSRMSHRAAQRARRQSGAAQTTARELALILGREPQPSEPQND